MLVELTGVIKPCFIKKYSVALMITASLCHLNTDPSSNSKRTVTNFKNDSRV